MNARILDTDERYICKKNSNNSFHSYLLCQDNQISNERDVTIMKDNDKYLPPNFPEELNCYLYLYSEVHRKTPSIVSFAAPKIVRGASERSHVGL